jgi:hypothetical protein
MDGVLAIRGLQATLIDAAILIDNLAKAYVAERSELVAARSSTVPTLVKAVPYSEIESQIAHIQQNGIDVAKLGGQMADEGRCRELCAMYLREFINTEELRQKLVDMDYNAPRSAIAPKSTKEKS